MNKRRTLALLLVALMLFACGCRGRAEEQQALTPDQAKELVLQRVKGADLADFWEFETDRDDGRLEYEGKIVYDGVEYEFEIDGYSGNFRRWESERADRVQ